MHERRPYQAFWRVKQIHCPKCCAFTAGKHDLEPHMASNQNGACVLLGSPCLMRSACPAGKHGMELPGAWKSMLALAMKACTSSTDHQSCAACWPAWQAEPWAGAAISAAPWLDQSLLLLQQSCAAYWCAVR